MKDPYEVLGIARSATTQEINRAFRKLAAKHHPDKNPDDSHAVQRFKELNAAHQILSDDKKRSLYDRFGAVGLGAARAGHDGPFPGVPIDLSDINIDGIFGDLLDALGIRFGDRGDIRQELTISFEQAAMGCTQQVSYDRAVPCESCGGSGAEPGSRLEDCSACNGRGRVRYQQGILPIAVERTCSRCRGTGRVVLKPCSECHGVGLTTCKHTVEVSIPPGVEAGSSRRLEGMGNVTRSGRRPGDLELTVQVKPHAFFRRSGDNIVCSLPITFAQATLGDEIEIPTLEGKGVMRIPAGTQPGTALRVRGKGIPRRRRGGRGDQLVEIQVEIPTQLSDRQKELIMALADELGESVQPQRQTFVEKLRALFS